MGISRHVFGFDIFDSDLLVSGIDTLDKGVMSSLFMDRNFNPLDYEETLSLMLNESGFLNCKLIKGDIFDSAPKFLETNPGFKASVINFDLDTEKPTTFALNSFWDRIVPGGVMIFDEYAISEWTENNAVDKFIAEKNLHLRSTNIFAPTAYIIKN